ncbi:MAG: DNA polymerase III subunit beta, partial [Candidatus Magasanikbacteria bacterium]
LQNLQIVNNVANSKTNLPILNNILISVDESKVEFLSTNLEIGIKTQVRAKIDAPGRIAVPGKMLHDYINLVTDENIEISTAGEELCISCDGSVTKMKGMDAEDYPIIPDVTEGTAFTLLADVFAVSLSKTVIASSKSDIRPELSGVFLGFNKERHPGLLMAATDSYRLAERKMSLLQGEETLECIVPARAVQEIIRLLSLVKGDLKENQVRLWVSENQIGIRYDMFEFSSRLVSGNYPDYAQIIPTQFKTDVTLPVDVFLKKIKAASLFTTSGINAIKLGISSEKQVINISSSSTQVGEHASVVEASVSGENNEITLNYRYLLDGLMNLDESDSKFLVNGPDSPCMIRSKNKEDYLYIIMPIRQ